MQREGYMTEEQYYRIADACDRLLRRSDAPLEWIAIPWLHVLSEHPVHLAPYIDLIENASVSDGNTNHSRSLGRMITRARESAYRVASLTRNVIRAAPFASRQKLWASSELCAADVIIVSWLVNVDHLQTPQQTLPVVIRCGQGLVCKGRVINVSTQGMLVEFPKGQVPPVQVDAHVSVKLHYLGDSIWLPGLVRYRMGHKIGFYFSSLTNQPKRNTKHPLTVVLHSLSRAVVAS